MYFKQILDEQCGCASYVVASRQSREAAVVDPALDVQQYIDLFHERNFKLRYVIDTHVHADHISGARLLAAATGAELCLYETAQVQYSYRPLHDGENLSLGQVVLHVVHTPGHRREMTSILIVNPPRSPEASMVMTGDSLLVGDVGRPDFGGGDAAQQYDSVGRIMRLPDWVAVFPGHFEGPCGKGMCGRPSTTIGFERLYNPLVRLEREPFIAALEEAVPARPLNMVAIEATNRGAADTPWAMLRTSPQIPEVDVTTLGSDDQAGLLLDVREPAEYAHGHIPGAVNLPQAELALRIDELPRHEPIVVVCQSGGRSLRVSQFLMQRGFKNVSTGVGGTEAWAASGKELAYGDTSIDAPRVVETEWAHAGASVPSAVMN